MPVPDRVRIAAYLADASNATYARWADEALRRQGERHETGEGTAPTVDELARELGLGRDDIARLLLALRRGRLEGADLRLTEHIPFLISGTWRDVFVYEDGSRAETGFVSENLVVNAFSILLSALLLVGRSPSYAGISYMALGQGDGSWTTNPAAPSPADTILLSEFTRAQVTVVDCDAAGNTVGSGPTGKLLCSGLWLPGQALGSIREFGLWGGNAASGHTMADANQGIMVNHITHGVIVKSSSADFSLLRQVILSI